MERVTINEQHIGISSCGFIYSRVKRAYCSSVSDLGYKKWKGSLKEHDNIAKAEILATQIWMFQFTSSLFQSLCIHWSNKKINQGTDFNFAEMLGKSVEHEGRGKGTEGRRPFNRAVDRGLNKSNSLL